MDRVNIDMSHEQFKELVYVLEQSARNFEVDALNEIDEGYEEDGQRCERMLEVLGETGLSYFDPGDAYTSVQEILMHY